MKDIMRDKKLEGNLEETDAVSNDTREFSKLLKWPHRNCLVTKACDLIIEEELLKFEKKLKKKSVLSAFLKYTYALHNTTIGSNGNVIIQY